MTVEEARAAILPAVQVHVGALGKAIRTGDSSCAEGTWEKVLEAIDAYALEAHVAACGQRRLIESSLHGGDYLIPEGPQCGDDWYCARARPYRGASS